MRSWARDAHPYHWRPRGKSYETMKPLEFPNGIITEMKYDVDYRCTIRYRIHAIKLREIIKKIEEKYR